MSAKPLRLALFGSGRIGQVHARNITANPDLELAFIADPFIEGAKRLAEGTGAQVVQDPQEIFGRDDVDGVIIGSPTPTHVDLLTRSVASGFAVLCEKPIDLDIDVVMACRERIADSEVPIMLGFNRRFDPSFAAVKRRVQEGEIGTLEQLTIISRDPAPAPRDYIASSGGIFRDMTIHDFDMARFFIPEIVGVAAAGANMFSDEIREFDDYDSAIVTLHGSRGELVSITNSRHCASGYDQRLEAFGSTGMLSAANLPATTVSKSTAAGTSQADPYMPFFLERYAEAYRDELGAFAHAIRGGGPCSPGFDDGVAALQLANAALESATTGRTVSVGPVGAL